MSLLFNGWRTVDQNQIVFGVAVTEAIRIESNLYSIDRAINERQQAHFMGDGTLNEFGPSIMLIDVATNLRTDAVLKRSIKIED